jgi:F-type H+-transporting ATPase subunit delta
VSGLEPSRLRRVCRALVAVASREGDAAGQRLGAELEGLADVVSGSAALRDALENPRVRAEQRRAILEQIAAVVKLSPLTRGVLVLLVEQDAVLALPTLAQAYGEAWNAHRGTAAAEAVAAVPLSPSQERDLARALARVSGREVQLHTRVDPAVIGGLRVRVGDMLYDGSVRAHLQALRRRLASGR